MAILPSQPGIQVSIVCNGAILQEYEDDEDALNDTVVTRYIESTSGAEFGIRWTITPPWPKHSIMFKCFLNQKHACGTYAMLESFNNPSYTYTLDGPTSFKDGSWFLHKFCFTELIVDDTGEVKMQDKLMKNLKGMGEITVKVYFVKNVRSVSRVVGTVPNDLKELGKLPEKALKGQSLSHQTSLRAPQVTASHKISNCDHVDSNKQPFATYVFKYRSKDALKSLLLIPRSPSPVPLEDRDVDTLSSEELRELVRLQRERDAAARAVKQEAGVKRERNRDRSSIYTEDASDDEPLVVSAKRRRETFPTTINENGVEEIDLT